MKYAQSWKQLIYIYHEIGRYLAYIYISIHAQLYFFTRPTHSIARGYARRQAKYRGAGAQAEQLLLSVLERYGVTRSEEPKGATVGCNGPVMSVNSYMKYK
jgi:hypothetical protein